MAFEEHSMYIRNIGLAVTLASLVGGCSFFGGPAQKETDTDAIQRAEDPYHTAAKYNPYTRYNPKTPGGTHGLTVMGLLFGSGDQKGGDRNSRAPSCVRGNN